MRAHLAKYDISVELSTGLVGIEQTADQVTATLESFADGQPTGRREILTCRYLVGADGARGVSRKLLGLNFAGETRDTDGMVWGDVLIDGLDSSVSL
jgi:2-polyprenyl-6-methoxyphenol hydroxylase-like FAD-dependent oxidoreductase